MFTCKLESVRYLQFQQSYQHEEFARLQAVVYTVHVVMFRIRCTIVTLYYRPLIGSDTDDLSNCATSDDLQWRSRSCICWKPFEMQQLTVLQMIWMVRGPSAVAEVVE